MIKHLGVPAGLSDRVLRTAAGASQCAEVAPSTRGSEVSLALTGRPTATPRVPVTRRSFGARPACG